MRLGILLLLGAVLLGACGRSEHGDLVRQPNSAAPISAEDREFVLATPRGLAAGVLDHLNPDRVGTVSVSKGFHGAGSVMVELGGGLLLGLDVSPYLPGTTSGACIGDQSFTRLICDRAGNLYIGQLNPRFAPAIKGVWRFEGRTGNVGRGDVLVQLWGDWPKVEAVRLVRALLEDERLGLSTTVSLNARGAKLQHVRKLKIVTTITPVN